MTDKNPRDGELDMSWHWVFKEEPPKTIGEISVRTDALYYDYQILKMLKAREQ